MVRGRFAAKYGRARRRLEAAAGESFKYTALAGGAAGQPHAAMPPGRAASMLIFPRFLASDLPRRYNEIVGAPVAPSFASTLLFRSTRLMVLSLAFLASCR
jgi:hypothetical protein